GRPRKHGAVTHGPEGSETNTMVEAEQRPAAAAGVDAPGPLVQLHGVTKRYGRLVALRSVDLTIAPGEFLFLIGPSEAGKTTLLKLIHGDLRPTQGAVRVADHQLHRRWGRSL